MVAAGKTQRPNLPQRIMSSGEGASEAGTPECLEAPYRHSRKILGIGLKYRVHAGELGVDQPHGTPASFLKRNHAIVDRRDPVARPSGIGRNSAEAPLGVGDRVRTLPRHDRRRIVLRRSCHRHSPPDGRGRAAGEPLRPHLGQELPDVLLEDVPSCVGVPRRDYGYATSLATHMGATMAKWRAKSPTRVGMSVQPLIRLKLRSPLSTPEAAQRLTMLQSRQRLTLRVVVRATENIDSMVLVHPREPASRSETLQTLARRPQSTITLAA